MVSLFIHIYPPLVLTTVRHFYPDSETRFPALLELPTLNGFKAVCWSALFCTFYSPCLPLVIHVLSLLIDLTWQGLYWRLLIVRRQEKIKSGLRTTSFSFLLRDKRGAIGKMLRAVNPNRAELYFMMGYVVTHLKMQACTNRFVLLPCFRQFAYSIVTELPAIFILYDSPQWSMVFLAIIFAATAWNGGGFYIEVFGRKYMPLFSAFPSE